jgi:hypothetical protein
MNDINVNSYPHIEQDIANWKSNNTIDVNPIPFDNLFPPTLVTSGPHAGSMLFRANYTTNMAGGLYSYNIPYPPVGMTGRSFQYVAMNIRKFVPAYAPGTLMRDEMDFKWTFAVNGVQGWQANVSTQINKSNGQLQLDPTGKKWVNSGYVPTSCATGQSEVYQIRAWSDLATVWTVTGFQCNDEYPFIPGPAFQNIPLIQTATATSGPWSSGIHPQVQGEFANAPFEINEFYARIDILTSDFPIPFIDPMTF